MYINQKGIFSKKKFSFNKGVYKKIFFFEFGKKKKKKFN
jgi:hypothetical protein